MYNLYIVDCDVKQAICTETFLSNFVRRQLFHIFDFFSKLLNRIQWNLSGCTISTSPTKFVIFGLIEKQDGRPCLLLAETLSTSLKPLNPIQRNLTGSKISMSSTKFVFLGRSETQDCRPGLWLAETFSTSLQPLNGIRQNLTGNKISMSSTKFVFFGLIGKRYDRPGLWLACQETYEMSMAWGARP